MQAQVYKIHSDFYYVKNFEHKEFVCKLRDVLKKQKIDVVVGDYVELSEDNSSIVKLIQRKNYLPRPKASNINYALVVCALREPELDLVQLDRFLIYLKYHKINALICFNKEDLSPTLEDDKEKLKNIYTGYKLFFISAKNKLNLDSLEEYILDKTIVLCGVSGVGKSTLINSLTDKNAKTNDVSKKNFKGTHTTRHCELIEYNNFKLIDTPGFSCLKFDFLLPNQLFELFDDLKIYANSCKYANCSHTPDESAVCSLYNNLDKVNKSRYESYLTFLDEAREYREKISKKSIKNEHAHKNSGNKIFTKISKKKREQSRKKEKQSIRTNE